MGKNVFHKMEVAGIFFTLAIGFLLRGTYEWTQGTAWTVIFASVNTSVWEQIKVFGVPYIVWSIITLAVARPAFRAFFTAKIMGVYTIVFGQMLLYSLFRGVIGRRVIAIEVPITLIVVVMGYILSSRLTYTRDIDAWFVTAFFALMLFAASYFCFTYSPPQAGVFIDEKTDSYGVPASEEYNADAVLDAMYRLGQNI